MSDEEPKDAIVIEFLETGSTQFSVSLHGTVSPLQLMLLGDYLQTIGKASLLEQREASRIQVPKAPESKIVVPGR